MTSFEVNCAAITRFFISCFGLISVNRLCYTTANKFDNGKELRRVIRLQAGQIVELVFFLLSFMVCCIVSSGVVAP